MSRKFLSTMLAMVLCAFSMAAGNVRFMVDTPANVKVSTQSGNGRVLDLEKSNGLFSDLTSADSPILIEANEGATIESVIVNGNPQIPSGDGKYRFGVDDNGMMIQITTSGTAVGGGETARDVALYFYSRGESITGNPFSISYQSDGAWKEITSNSQGIYLIPENSTVKVTPMSPYTVDSLTDSYNNVVNTTPDNGSLTFVCDYNKFNNQFIYVNMGIAPGAVKFSIDADCAANFSAVLEYGRQDESKYETLSLKDGKNQFVCLPDAAPIEFTAKNGAEIASITLNGNEMSPTGGGTMWMYGVNDGDEFVVKTKGKPVEVLLATASETDAPLESYIYEGSSGNVYTPKGNSDKISSFVGEKITVTPRPGTEISYVWTSNGGTYGNYYFTAAEGKNGTEPMTAFISGKRATGVTIKVDVADRIKIQQEGGRGDILTLKNGENSFSLAELKNALAVSATSGNQLTTVNLSGTPQTANAQGIYMVNVAEGDYLTITSRKSPVDVTMSVNVTGGNFSTLKASIDGQDIELASTINIKTYAYMVLQPAAGYRIDKIDSDKAIVTKGEGVDSYMITIDDAEITKATLNVTVSEIPASQGNANVVPYGDEILIKYREFTKEGGEYKFVKLLENNTVNEVAIGNYVNIYRNDGQQRFKSIKVNGEEIEFNPEDRQVYVLIEDRTTIEAETYTVSEAIAQESYDEVKNIKSGAVYFIVDGERKTSLMVSVGETVELEAVPERGYLLDYIEIFTDYSGVGRKIEGNNYTFTAEDLKTEFIVFKGIFSVDENEKSFVVRGTTAWLVDENNEVLSGTSSAVGTVWIVNPSGEYVSEYIGVEGETVDLAVGSTEEFQDKYRVKSYCFSEDFPNKLIDGSSYTINEADANEEGIIWITALIEEIPGSVEAVELNGKFRYDSAAEMLFAPAAVSVYDIAGNLLIDAEATQVSLENLPAGLYIAISNGTSLKFIK